MMFFHSKRYLKKFVNDCLLGKADFDVELRLADLDIDETWYFWVMYGIGSSRVTGMISRETARDEQIRAEKNFVRMRVQLFFHRKIKAETFNNFRNHSLAVSKADRALFAREPKEFLYAVMDAFSAILNESVHAEMFRRAAEDTEFMKKCIDALIENEDYFTKKFKGAIHCESYLKLLEKFYAACVEDGSAELFNGFGEESSEDVIDVQDDLTQFAKGNKMVYNGNGFYLRNEKTVR